MSPHHRLTLFIIALFLWLNCQAISEDFTSVPDEEHRRPQLDSLLMGQCRRACNTSSCPQIGKCRRGRLALDHWNCCRVCYRQEGQMCNPLRGRPCDPAQQLVCATSSDISPDGRGQDGHRNTSSTGRKKCCLRHAKAFNIQQEFAECCGRNESYWFDGCSNCSCVRGVKKCSPRLCPRPKAPQNCPKIFCPTLPVAPGQCCPVYLGSCVCINGPTVTVTTPGEDPRCMPKCRIDRGKNELMLRYAFDETTQRCSMFWRSLSCNKGENFHRLSECQESCLPKPKRCDWDQHQCGIIDRSRNTYFCWSVKHAKQLFRGKVSHVEQTSAGMLFTVRVQRVYIGSCLINSKLLLFADGKNRTCPCPDLEKSSTVLIGFDSLRDDCSGIHFNDLNMTAIAIKSHPNNIAVPWSKEIDKTIRKTCGVKPDSPRIDLT